MKPIQIIPKKIFLWSMIGGGALLILFVTLFMRPIERSSDPMAEGMLQEKIGYAIQAVGSYDEDRVTSFMERWAVVAQQAKEFESRRAGRLQEALGQTIARTGQMIWMEQSLLRAAVAVARDDLQRFKEEKVSRWQEQLGKGVIVAARRAPEGGDAFQAAFQREVNRMKKVEGRTSHRLESRLENLTAQETKFHKTIPILYEEAIESAHRSNRMLEESQAAWTRRVFDGLNDRLAWQRGPEDYMELARAVRENMAGPQVVSGFVEYGLPALAGLILVVVWLAAITRKSVRH